MSRSEWERAVSASSTSGDDLSVLTLWTGVLTDDPVAAGGLSGEFADGLGSLEVFTVDGKGRTTALRTVFERAEDYPAGGADPVASFHADAIAYVAGLLDVPETEVRRHAFNPFGPVTDRGSMA